MEIVFTSIILAYFVYFTYNIIIYFKDKKADCKNKVEYIPIPDIIHSELNIKYN